QQAVLEASAYALNGQRAEAMRITGRELKGQDCAKRHAHQSGRLQTIPIEELVEILNQVRHAEAAAQGKAVVLAPELVANDLEVLSQYPGEWSEESKAACQARNHHQGRTITPDTVLNRIIVQ